MRRACAVYRNDNTTSCPGWMVLDRYGRAHQWFPIDGVRANSPHPPISLQAYHDAEAKARKVAEALNGGGVGRELELRKKGL